MAIRAAQTMTLVLGDKRLDLRQFPNLMSQCKCAPLPCEHSAALGIFGV